MELTVCSWDWTPDGPDWQLLHLGILKGFALQPPLQHARIPSEFGRNVLFRAACRHHPARPGPARLNSSTERSHNHTHGSTPQTLTRGAHSCVLHSKALCGSYVILCLSQSGTKVAHQGALQRAFLRALFGFRCDPEVHLPWSGLRMIPSGVFDSITPCLMDQVRMGRNSTELKACSCPCR